MVLALLPDGKTTRSVSVTLPDRKSSIRWFPDLRLVVIRKGKVGAIYRVREFPVVNGRGFQFVRLATEEEDGAYRVQLANGQETIDHECSCRGFGLHRHCKHVDTAVAIVDAAGLPGGDEFVPAF